MAPREASVAETNVALPPGSWARDPGRRRNMQANKSRGTSCEMSVRRLLHAQGLRYRVHRRPIPTLRRTADIVFGPARVAVFIDGCYWHGCPEHFAMPGRNRDYWEPKIQRNRERDRETTLLLEEAGWVVVRYWEHVPAGEVASAISEVVARRRQAN